MSLVSLYILNIWPQTREYSQSQTLGATWVSLNLRHTVQIHNGLVHSGVSAFSIFSLKWLALY